MGLEDETSDDLFVGLFKLVHDICLVRPSAEFQAPGIVYRHYVELGSRILRVLLSSARQPNWLSSFLAGATKSDSGNHHHVCVRIVLHGVHGRTTPLGLPLGWIVHGGSGLLHVPWNGSGLVTS